MGVYFQEQSDYLGHSVQGSDRRSLAQHRFLVQIKE
jgi:hypothetical protein